MNTAFRRLAALAAIIGSSFTLNAQLPVDWNVAELYNKVPHASEIPNMCTADGVKAVRLDGLTYKGEPASFFAYYQVPEGADAEHPVPAVVLVHGGGGSAYANWVQEWVKRGYAAISMDTTGKIPARIENDPLGLGWANWAILPGGVNLNWGGYERALLPIEDQWAYHAVTEVVLAHNFLRSLPGVDAERTGITGNSWGGFLTILTGAVDNRFKFVAPLYACSFYDQFKNNLSLPGDETSNRWLELWDPSHYLPEIKAPLMMYGGAGDVCFDFGCLEKSFLTATCPLWRVTFPAVIHTDGGAPEGRPAEVYAFAEQILKGGDCIPAVTLGQSGKKKLLAKFDTDLKKVTRLDFFYTTDREGKWQDRKWQTVQYDLLSDKNLSKAAAKGEVYIPVPEGIYDCFVNVVTEDGLSCSSQMLEVAPKE